MSVTFKWRGRYYTIGVLSRPWWMDDAERLFLYCVRWDRKPFSLEQATGIPPSFK